MLVPTGFSHTRWLSLCSAEGQAAEPLFCLSADLVSDLALPSPLEGDQ